MTYRIAYLNARRGRVWCLLLAGTTIARRSALVAASERLGRPPLALEYQDAQATKDALNRHLAAVGMPGRCLTVPNL